MFWTDEIQLKHYSSPFLSVEFCLNRFRRP